MSGLTLDALFRGLRKGAVDPVYYLHGDEDVLKDEAIRAIADLVLEPSTRDFNLDQPDVASLDVERLRTLLDTSPMLAARRLVVLRGIGALRKKSRVRDALLRSLITPNPTTILVLVEAAGIEPAEDLVAAATAVRLDRLPPERAERWALHRAAQLGLTLEAGAAAHLAAALAGDLGTVATELDKLAAAVSGRAATRSDVERLIGVRHGETLQDLVAAALSRRPAEAVRLVGPVLGQSSMSGVKIVTALGTALVGTALARAELDSGIPPARAEQVVFRRILAARPAGIPRWKDAAAQWVRWAQGWHPAELRQALRRTLAADCALKGPRLSTEEGIVIELVTTWAVASREAA